MRRAGIAALLGVALLLSALLMSAAPAQATPGDPYAPQYYFDQWRVPQLWAAGAKGQGITIAEIDTGVDASLGIFAGRLVPGVDLGRLGGNGFVDRDTDPYGHGTSMASIMVGRPGRFGIEGLAPSARVMPVAIPLEGTTDATKQDHLAEAIRYAADHGAKIISMSLGGVRRAAQDSTACPPDEQRAIFHALQRGALVLAAAGNRGATDNAVEEPSVCLGVVSVGAVDRRGTVASFSSRHPYLTLSAPGVNIASIGPGGSPFAGDGTSQATAVASAVAALVWSKYPAASARQVLARIIATTDRRSATRDPAYGYGIVDAYRAVTAAVKAGAPDPVYSLAMPFVAQAAARATPPAAPRPMQRADNPPGAFSVGSVPRLRDNRVLVGSGVAGAGVLALVVLAVAAGMSRRRRAIAAAAQPSPPAPGSEPPTPPALGEMQWRDIPPLRRPRPPT